MKFGKKGDKPAAKGEAKAPAADGAAKAAKSNLIPAVVIAVGLLGGGFFMGQGGSAPAPETAEAAEEHASEEPSEGPVHKLEPITLNLADGHFLKIGLGLQAVYSTEGGGGHGGEEEMPEGETAKALDAAVELFGKHTMKELQDPKVREHAKAELTEHVKEAYHDEIEKVYFTEFVMQ